MAAMLVCVDVTPWQHRPVSSLVIQWLLVLYGVVFWFTALSQINRVSWILVLVLRQQAHFVALVNHPIWVVGTSVSAGRHKGGNGFYIRRVIKG